MGGGGGEGGGNFGGGNTNVMASFEHEKIKSILNKSHYEILCGKLRESHQNLAGKRIAYNEGRGFQISKWRLPNCLGLLRVRSGAKTVVEQSKIRQLSHKLNVLRSRSYENPVFTRMLGVVIFRRRPAIADTSINIK